MIGRRMGRTWRAAALLLAAGEVFAQTTADADGGAEAVWVGRVEGWRCERGSDGRIRTVMSVRVIEALHGRMGRWILAEVPGGRIDGEGEWIGCVPSPAIGAELVFHARRGTGRRASVLSISKTTGGSRAPAGHTRRGPLALGPLAPPADWTSWEAEALAALNGMTTNPITGAPGRFIAGDREVPIRVLVDMDAWPAGLTSNQVLAAIETALNAWAAVTSLTFTNEGVVSFGMGADQITTDDGRLRIQVHDLYHRILGGSTLGIGGHAYRYDATLFPTGGLGGRVRSTEFDLMVRGYVVLQHTNSALSNVATFEEVVAHEIGHALGLRHTSENPSEPDPALREALMYYRAHADGRGAALYTTDVANIRQAYPPDDTPPWSLDRILDVVTGFPSPPAVPGVNEVEIAGLDREGSPLRVELVSATSINGVFTLDGALLRYTPSGWHSASRLDPAGASYYDRAVLRLHDATNASPPVSVRVLSYAQDGIGTSDGLPNAWMTAYFGHSDPRAGDKSRAGDDPDGDGFTNLEEFLAGTDPTNAASRLTIISANGGHIVWSATPDLMYEVQATSELSSGGFQTVRLSVPTGTTGSARWTPPETHRFFRVRRTR